MSRINYEIFGSDAEVTEFVADTGIEFILDFGNSLEGLVSIEGVVSRVNNGRCLFDSRLIDHGEHNPLLILKDKVVRLPGIVKSYGKIRPSVCSDDYTRDVSIRERRLSMRVEALEKELKILENKITRTIL